MECYTSESSSSDSDYSAAVKTLDYSYLMLTNQDLSRNIQKLVVDKSNPRERKPDIFQTLLMYNNQITDLPSNVSLFYNLRHLDISNNRLTSLPDFLTKFPLTALVAKNNLIRNENLPKSFENWATSLKIFNLGGNNLNYFPMQLLDLMSLKYLYLGSNHIEDIPRNINKIIGLSVLCLGGNQLTDVPDTVGSLEHLEVLIVSDNKLESLPSSIANLTKLKTLQLHKNRLRTLPTEIITLKCLSELSLRENPLVVQFVNDMTHNPTTLQEMSARMIKIFGIHYDPCDVPRSLHEYLQSAHHCVNPRCNGVFFDNRVEHIKFVDFCGKYRIPLLQYLCSSKCVLDNSAIQGPSTADNDLMRKVLLG